MQARDVKGSLRALLWDVDGTLAETELDGHRIAFNRAFAQQGLPWQWDRSTYIELLAISGGRERLRWFLQRQQGGEPEASLLDALHQAKQAHYRELVVAGEVQLRPGVRRLIKAAAAAGLQQAIVTTSGREAVAALLENQLRDQSRLLPLRICADDVGAKKPDPEAYVLALQRLGLDPGQAVALEDSQAGLAAANSLSAVFNTVLLLYALRRKIARLGGKDRLGHLGQRQRRRAMRPQQIAPGVNLNRRARAAGLDGQVVHL